MTFVSGEFNRGRSDLIANDRFLVDRNKSLSNYKLNEVDSDLMNKDEYHYIDAKAILEQAGTGIEETAEDEKILDTFKNIGHALYDCE